MAKKSISELPPLTAAKTDKSDLLVIVNNNTTKHITLDNLFTAGLARSSENIISSSTTIGNNLFVADVNSDLIGIGGAPVAGNILTAYGDVKVPSPYRFITDGGTSTNWNQAYANTVNFISNLTSGPHRILVSNTAQKITSAQLIDSPTIALVYDEGNNEISFVTTGAFEANGSVYLANNWILSTGVDAGISLSANNTVAICPDGHGKTYGVGNTSSGLTHVDGYATTIWGNVFIDGKIKLSNLNDSFEGFSFGTMAGQNANNVIITSGTISGVSLVCDSFESTGIKDEASTKTIKINSSNNVGIGNLSPTEKLDIIGNIKSTGIIVNNTANSVATIKSSSYSVVDLKNNISSTYGIRLQTDGDYNNEILYRNSRTLKFKTSANTVATFTGDGRFVIGPSVLTTSSYLQISGPTDERSSIALTNTNLAAGVNKYSNLFFGNSSLPQNHWVKVCHENTTGNLAKTMSFGIQNIERLRISNTNIYFMDIAGNPLMDFDSVNGKLSLAGKEFLQSSSNSGVQINATELWTGSDTNYENGSYYLDWNNFTGIPSPTITFTGGVSGSGIINNLGDSTFNINVNANNHIHSASTINATGFGLAIFGQDLKPTSNVQFENLTITGTITESSDRKFKENITEITGALDIINSITGVRYNKIYNPDKIEIGFIAQELEEVLPEVVETDEHGVKSVNYSRIVALLVQAIKELKNQIK